MKKVICVMKAFINTIDETIASNGLGWPLALQAMHKTPFKKVFVRQSHSSQAMDGALDLMVAKCKDRSLNTHLFCL